VKNRNAVAGFDMERDILKRDDNENARLTAAEPRSPLTVGELNAFLLSLPSLGDDADDFAQDVRAIRANME